MNRDDFVLSLSARPTTHRSAFTDAVMRKINTPEKPTILFRLRHLHGPALVAAIIAMVIAVSGVAYAATVLWNIVNVGVSPAGRQQYVVQGTQSCQDNGGTSTLNRFEIKSDAPKLSEEESKKIIRAACEIGLSNQLAQKLQANYGPRKQPEVGDTLQYVMPGFTGVVKMATDKQISVEAYGQTTDYKTVPGQSYQVYDAELHASSQSLKPGDVVSPISLVKVVYSEENTHSDNPSGQNLLSVIKLSLPIEYYTTYQSYVTEVPTCIGNQDELCPNTASVDVYPRSGGEGAQNPQLKVKDGQIVKQISGNVTSLTANTIVIRTRSGAEFTITLGEPGFEQFNTIYAKNYTDVDVRIKEGSSIMVMYYEAPGEHAKSINPAQVQAVSLLLEGTSPKSSLKQY